MAESLLFTEVKNGCDIVSNQSAGEVMLELLKNGGNPYAIRYFEMIDESLR